MEKPKKADPLEEAHFRIDEHERRFNDIDRATEAIPALVEGGVGALRASLKSEFLDELRRVTQATQEDSETDKAVVKEVGELISELKELCAHLRDVVRVLSAPTTRTATIHLPSGPVTMVAREETH